MGGNPGRQQGRRVHAGRRKKLASALRWDLERKGTSDFLQTLLDEDEEAAEALPGKQEEIARPEDAEWPAWSLYIRNAWSELRDDRHFGAMGGMGRIYWTAIDRYALRYRIAGEAFENFLMFLRAIDDEYLRHTHEKQKEEAEKKKANR